MSNPPASSDRDTQSPVDSGRAPTSSQRARSVFRHVPSQFRLWSVAIIGLAIDLWSKQSAFDRLMPHDPNPPSLISGVVRLELSLNPGALFGMGSGWVSLFIIASFAALAFVLYMFAGSRRSQRFVHISLGLILAGALGNLYDRAFIRYDLAHVQVEDGGPERIWIGHLLGNPNADVIEVRDWGRNGRLRSIEREDLSEPVERVGVVRDFLKFEPIAGWDYWPWVFNVADVYLVIGVALLLICHLVESFEISRRRRDPANHPRK